jgi:drug/metabolite transporter (DMT)-like permease
MLVLLSAFMHAAWNLLARRHGNVEACIWRLQLTVVVAGFLPACVALVTLRCIPPLAALCLLGSGTSCAFYYVCLARGYETGDFTTVYPAARALPVLLVGVGDALRGRPPTGTGWIGMALVAFGCLIVPLSSLRDIRLRHYLRPASLWILLTATGTVGYSLFDKVGTEAIPRGPLPAAVYCYLFFAVAAAAYLPLRYAVLRRGLKSTAGGWRLPALAGLLGFLAYWLVLWAFQMTARASYVVAFRQFSIVIGVALALLLLNEPGKSVRFTGALIITAGLILLKALG